MSLFNRIWTSSLSLALIFAISSPDLLAQSDCGTAKTAVPAPAPRDGQHDFDFELGTWKIHLKRLLHPLTGSSAWVEFDGTSVTRKVWNGRANLEEFETDGPTGHIEGLTLRLYNPQSRQWSLFWANGKDGILGQPMIGEFKNGRGEFFDQEPFNGRAILVRYVWSDMTPTSAHFEQSFSADGGQTWEVNWITDQTRVSEEPAKAAENDCLLINHMAGPHIPVAFLADGGNTRKASGIAIFTRQEHDTGHDDDRKNFCSNNTHRPDSPAPPTQSRIA